MKTKNLLEVIGSGVIIQIYYLWLTISDVNKDHRKEQEHIDYITSLKLYAVTKI
jgi:hypothetical protein